MDIIGLILFITSSLISFGLGRLSYKTKYDNMVLLKSRLIDALEKKIGAYAEQVDALNEQLTVTKNLCATHEAIANDLRAELAKVNDPETRRVVAMRKQMQQDQAAFNLLFNYGQEMAYGQVSPADVMGIKEGKVE